MRKPLISLDNIRLRLGGCEILRNVTCAVQDGRHIAVGGDNGSGKSSLLRIFTGELWPTRECGQRVYSFDGVAEFASPLLVRPYVRRVAPEMQERFLRLGLSLSVFEFVASGLLDRDYAQISLSEADEARVCYMLQHMRLQTVAQQEARKLSHGMLRRAFVARALVAQPRILALDEVTDGLDAASRDVVLAMLDHAVEGGTTLVCVAHRIERLPSCVQVFYALREGELHAVAAPKAPAYHSGQSVEVTKGDDVAGQLIVELIDVDVVLDDTRVLSGINLAIRAGEHLAIVGENGAGKSTLAGVIDGTFLASVGRVIRPGFMRRPSIWELRRLIVTLSDALQVRHDWMFSVRDTIASGFSQAVGTSEELDASQQARLDSLSERFALRELSDRELPTLSFGQRRRALLARALVRDPQMLILDEIFDGLDAATRAMLEHELATLAQARTTILCISHVDEEVPPYIRRRVTMKNGRITAITNRVPA